MVINNIYSLQIWISRSKTIVDMSVTVADKETTKDAEGSFLGIFYWCIQELAVIFYF